MGLLKGANGPPARKEVDYHVDDKGLFLESLPPRELTLVWLRVWSAWLHRVIAGEISMTQCLVGFRATGCHA